MLKKNKSYLPFFLKYKSQELKNACYSKKIKKHTHTQVATEYKSQLQKVDNKEELIIFTVCIGI